MDASSIKKKLKRNVKDKAERLELGERKVKTYCLNGKLSNLGFSRDEGKFGILRAGFPLLPYCREVLAEPRF